MTSSTMADGPKVKSASLFETRDSTTDVTFVVEDKHLYFCRALLVVSSPVFARMFSADFKEKESETIPLPGKSYAHFVTFLMQLHPAHSWLPLSDEDLEPLLKLADEYDVGHVKKKCEHFIGTQIQFTLTTGQVMKYLWLCNLYQLKENRNHLVSLAADHSVEDLQACQYYPLLENTSQLDLMVTRSRLLEDEKDEDKERLINTGRMIREVKSVIHRLPALVLTLPEECPGYCVPCPGKLYSCTGSTYDKRSWCRCRSFPVSSLQRSFCKCCVISKAFSIVKCLDLLPEGIKNVQCKSVTFSA